LFYSVLITLIEDLVQVLLSNTLWVLLQRWEIFISRAVGSGIIFSYSKLMWSIRLI